MMKKIQCLKCNKIINVKEIKKGTNIECECGCVQKCLDSDEFISRWRVVNCTNF